MVFVVMRRAKKEDVRLVAKGGGGSDDGLGRKADMALRRLLGQAS